MNPHNRFLADRRQPHLNIEIEIEVWISILYLGKQITHLTRPGTIFCCRSFPWNCRRIAHFWGEQVMGSHSRELNWRWRSICWTWISKLILKFIVDSYKFFRSLGPQFGYPCFLDPKIWFLCTGVSILYYSVQKLF